MEMNGTNHRAKALEPLYEERAIKYAELQELDALIELIGGGKGALAKPASIAPINQLAARMAAKMAPLKFGEGARQRATEGFNRASLIQALKAGPPNGLVYKEIETATGIGASCLRNVVAREPALFEQHGVGFGRVVRVSLRKGALPVSLQGPSEARAKASAEKRHAVDYARSETIVINWLLEQPSDSQHTYAQIAAATGIAKWIVTSICKAHHKDLFIGPTAIRISGQHGKPPMTVSVNPLGRLVKKELAAAAS